MRARLRHRLVERRPQRTPARQWPHLPDRAAASRGHREMNRMASRSPSTLPSPTRTARSWTPDLQPASYLAARILPPNIPARIAWRRCARRSWTPSRPRDHCRSRTHAARYRRASATRCRPRSPAPLHAAYTSSRPRQAGDDLQITVRRITATTRAPASRHRLSPAPPRSRGTLRYCPSGHARDRCPARSR